VIGCSILVLTGGLPVAQGQLQEPANVNIFIFLPHKTQMHFNSNMYWKLPQAPKFMNTYFQSLTFDFWDLAALYVDTVAVIHWSLKLMPSAWINLELYVGTATSSKASYTMTQAVVIIQGPSEHTWTSCLLPA